jgi:mannose-1-phosphate guanylyltransferase/mannose-6-phosphate isomerase
MITVIIAGGSGTRLWPLSTPEYPKHLLKLTNNFSLLQNTYNRAKLLGGEVYILTEASHSEHVSEQIPELDVEHIIVEPGRRGTAHCIMMALDVITRTHSYDEQIAFIHADHHIRDTDGFIQSFKTAAEVSTSLNEITLIGIEPTFPSVGFGYIERDSEIQNYRGVYGVHSFKEKPDYDTAQDYVTSGRYLWNCGYFVGSAKTFLDTMRTSASELLTTFTALHAIKDYTGQEYSQQYLALDNQVIDVALIEKAKKLAVVSAGFDWMDVGSYKDLHDAVEHDEKGNHLQGNIESIEIENIYVRNEEDKPIAVIGLDNIIVVNTAHGLVVARKDLSARVGEIAKKLQA